MHAVTIIGKNLLQLRSQRGLTLAGLSERSGVAKSTLSQLENGEGNPTIETLWAVANALGLPFGHLVEEQGGDHGKLSGNGVIVRLVEQSDDNPAIEVYVIELQPDCRKDSAPHPEGVKERITVLSGAMRVGATDRPRLLRAGESHTFDASVPHGYAATEAGGRALVVVEYPSRDCSDFAATQYLEWPQTPDAWAGARSMVERAMLEVSNGLSAGLLRLCGAPSSRPDGPHTLRQMVREISGGPLRWPLLTLVEDDARGSFVAIVPLPLPGAFGRPEPAPSPCASSPLQQTCSALARLAESPFSTLDDASETAVRAHFDGPLLVLHCLAAEVLLQRGHLHLPRTLRHQRPATDDARCSRREGSFSGRIDVEQYDAYELLHPAYARQVVAAAEDINNFAGATPPAEAINVGTGPGLPLLMLHELHPACRFLAVEPDDKAHACLSHNMQGVPGIDLHHGGFIELNRPAGQTRLITSFGASHHFNTAFMLQKAARLLCPGGLLVVADEFLPEFNSVNERQLALVRHHGAYLLASMAWAGEPAITQAGPDARVFLDFRRSITLALMAAAEGKTGRAVGLCRDLHERVSVKALRQSTTDAIGAFVRFYRLELQAMVAGFDYEVEQKTYPRRFAGLAALAGLEMQRHRRVFATVGGDDWGGGTHVFTFAKPDRR